MLSSDIQERSAVLYGKFYNQLNQWKLVKRKFDHDGSDCRNVSKKPLGCYTHKRYQFIFLQAVLVDPNGVHF